MKTLKKPLSLLMALFMCLGMFAGTGVTAFAAGETMTTYSPVQLLTVTPEEMVEIPGITVPNIRAVLCVQNKVLADRNKIRSGRLVEELLKEAGGMEVRP